VASRERARAVILAGQVTVDGRAVSKAGTAVAADARIELVQPDHPYVGRGGLKLAHALDAFRIRVDGRDALDIGASTGGFTDVLLRRGAAHVVAVDVGYGQLAWSLQQDPRVTVLDRTNVRHLTSADLPYTPDLVVGDLSFISLTKVLPALRAVADPAADFVLLVKPQFEVGKGQVGKGGVVRDPQAHAGAIEQVATAAAELGLGVAGLQRSPLPGPSGNIEFVVWLRSDAQPLTAEAVEEVVST
jgi:23S rRNA (cytidine1920-2'-O)/16S rRNA (cytidine1409-2'-O)-methyltransferase